MINREDPYISVIDTISDFDKIGEWTMEEMGVNPFIYFSYNGIEIRPIDHVMCKDTEGDCMKWIN